MGGQPASRLLSDGGWLPASFSDAVSRLIVRNRTSWGGSIYFCNLTCDFFQSLLWFLLGGFFASFLAAQSKAFGLSLFYIEHAQLVQIRKNPNSTLN